MMADVIVVLWVLYILAAALEAAGIWAARPLFSLDTDGTPYVATTDPAEARRMVRRPAVLLAFGIAAGTVGNVASIYT